MRIDELKKVCYRAYGRKNGKKVVKAHKLISSLMKSNAELGERVVRALFYTFLKLDEEKQTETENVEEEVK